MSTKFLRINGDYKITTEEGGTITLDTGNETGEVVITGDLRVEGNTTTIETINMTVEDNIILLNSNAPNNVQSGIEVERGSPVNGRWLFVDAIDWTDTTIPGTIRSGGWSGRDANGDILGIETVSITTGGNDFAFYLNSQAAKLYIDGAGSSYHLRVTEDDDIPNKRYVDDSITNFFNVTVPNRIEDGPLSDLTRVIALDNTTTSLPSKIKIDIDGFEKVEIYEDYADIYGLRIEELPNRGMEIKTNQTSGNDLILGAMGTGQVVIEDNFRIQRIGHEGDQTLPDSIPVPDEGVTVFANTSNAGATGLYFVNENEQRDELISRNRALLYSMIF